MAEEINITYETLFNVTRKEKMQEELQKLHPEFFNHLFKYISEKEQSVMSAPNDNLFARDERLMNQKQLENIRRIVTELYARRERKIMNLAIIKSRTNSRLLDTSNLLEEEKTLFNFTLHILNSSKKSILLNLLQGKEVNGLNIDLTNIPKVAHQSATEKRAAETTKHLARLEQDTLNKEKEKQRVSEQLSKSKPVVSSSDTSNIPVEPNTQTKPLNSGNSSGTNSGSIGVHGVESDNSLKKVNFLSAVPKFVGKELEIYGPFNQGDSATLPSDVAKVLINKGRAEEVN